MPLGNYLLGAARICVVLALCALALAGCARPVGDFGRAHPSVLHDRLMPAAGAYAARSGGEPVSGFVLTDEEREMHDRVWRFLVAPHANDWFYDVAVEWQRTRITGVTDTRFATDRYYHHLRATEYASSPVRYRAILHDIEVDISTLPATFAAVCAVAEIDRRRTIAVDRVNNPGFNGAADVAARRYENEARIAWFARALRYRHQSYAVALERLLVETPHEEARLLPPRLDAFGSFVLRAEAWDFCPGSATSPRFIASPPLPSRFELEPARELELK